MRAINVRYKYSVEFWELVKPAFLTHTIILSSHYCLFLCNNFLILYMIHLSYINSKVSYRSFVTVDFKQHFINDALYIYHVFALNHMDRSSGSLIIVIRPNTTNNFCTACLSDVLQSITTATVAYRSKIYYPRLRGSLLLHSKLRQAQCLSNSPPIPV